MADEHPATTQRIGGLYGLLALAWGVGVTLMLLHLAIWVFWFAVFIVVAVIILCVSIFWNECKSAISVLTGKPYDRVSKEGFVALSCIVIGTIAAAPVGSYYSPYGAILTLNASTPQIVNYATGA